MRPINEKAAAQYAANEGENTILLNVFTGEAEIDVEQTAVYEFEVVNAGPIVASFYVTVKVVLLSGLRSVRIRSI